MAKKKPNSMLAYTSGVSESDRRKTKDFYSNRVLKLGEKDNPNPLAYIAADQKTRDKMDAAHQAYGRASASYSGDVADQNRWIAKGAKANALAQMKLKKKSK